GGLPAARHRASREKRLMVPSSHRHQHSRERRKVVLQSPRGWRKLPRPTDSPTLRRARNHSRFPEQLKMLSLHLVRIRSRKRCYGPCHWPPIVHCLHLERRNVTL